ncbi:MAG: hypothetical protein SPI71_02875 [Acidaminococcaceae bacterium]|nr:hypothetical protein [Acidaminococcaceae bacterium]
MIKDSTEAFGRYGLCAHNALVTEVVPDFQKIIRSDCDTDA